MLEHIVLGSFCLHVAFSCILGLHMGLREGMMWMV